MTRLPDGYLFAAVDRSNAMVVILDGRRQVAFANQALVQALGAAPEELLGHELVGWIPEADRGAFERLVDRVMAGGPVSGEEVLLCGPEGEPVRGLFSLAPLPADGDFGPGVVAVGQDGSRLRALERQVIHVEKLATLGQLAAGVVHEINNPLTSITVYADYLLKKLKQEGTARAEVGMLEKIVESSARILKCVQDLVNYAKPSPARLDVLSLNDVVERSVSFCEHIMKRATATPHRELAFELPPLYGVEDQLQQVFINLITNACHALPAGGGELRIRTQDLGNGQLLAEVEDEGCGIEPQNLPHIFDPFFTTKKPGEGTGLGLSIVKKIVDFHHGSIMVRSKQGRGTVISVTLPSTRRGQPERSE